MEKQRQDCGERFIELARPVYKMNDERAAIKRQITDLLGPLSMFGDYLTSQISARDWYSPG